MSETNHNPYNSYEVAHTSGANSGSSGGSGKLNIDFTELWETRPVRIPEDQGSAAKVAGVCEGIGVRYQIDPTVVRVGFVVGTLAGGAGIPAYLAAWGLMPRYSKTTSSFEEAFMGADGGEKDESSTGWTLGIIGMLMLITGVAASGGALLLTAAVLGGAMVALHHRKPQPPPGLLAQERPASDDAVDLTMFEPVEGYPTPPGRITPPAWDPLGAAPDTWHLPDPAPREEPVARKGSAWKWPLLTAGGLSIAATALAAIFGLRFGSEDFTPTSVDQIPPEFSTTVGTLNLDLTQVQDWDKLDEPLDVTIDNGIGTVELSLPDNRIVDVTSNRRIGAINYDGEPAADAQDSLIDITVNGAVGSVDIDYEPAG